MNVNILAKEYGMVKFLSRPKIKRAFLHQQGIDTFVRR